MITEKNIRKIPKYIIELIKQKDKNKKQDGNTRFYKYFTKYNNELCEVGKLPPMEVENPALIQIIRDVQLKAIEKSENMKENMGES